MYNKLVKGKHVDMYDLFDVMCVLYSVPDEFDGAYDDEEPVRGISLQSECYEADYDHKKVNTRERESDEQFMTSSCQWTRYS